MTEGIVENPGLYRLACNLNPNNECLSLFFAFNKLVNKGSGKRSSSSGHNTCVPNHPATSTLYTLWVVLYLGKKRVSHAINKKYFFVLHGPSLPFSCESKFTFLPGRIICNLFATCP
jgi:hypothetical protein